MQIGIRLHDTKKGTLEERVAIAEEQGFSCAHLALKKVISEYSVADSALTPGFSCYLKNLFAAHHLDIAVLGCYLNLATPDQAVLEKNVHRYMAHIRMASLLGAGVVGTETGAVNESYSFEERNHSEEALDIFIKNVRPVVQYAEKMGVILAIEPVYKHIVCNPKRARKVLDEIGSPNLQIIFDPVNLLDISNYKEREAIIAEAIEVLGEDRSDPYQRFYRKRRSTGFGGCGNRGDGLYADYSFYQREKALYPYNFRKYDAGKCSAGKSVYSEAV